jgi:tripartite-type tricarboxylate transporter receptor subunit TctC
LPAPARNRSQFESIIAAEAQFFGEDIVRMLSRRCLLLGALIAPWAAHAQNWPAGNIKIVVPYPPGGSTDMIARLIQPHMQQRLGRTVIIENRPGGGGSIGTAAVAKSSPDGSTWAMVFDNHAANPFVFPNLPFNTEKDLDPVQLIGTAPYVLSTNPQKPFKTLADWSPQQRPNQAR